MNKRQKEMLQHQFDSEKAVLKQLEKQYQTALNDINRKIRILQSDEMTQSKIYRLEYQKALKKQVEAILEKLHSDEFTTIQEYLSASYTDSFVGTMYDLAGQGIPLIIPLDQAAAVTAILTDSKISEGLYSALGVDTGNLKKAISAEVTRGIASGMSYNDIARNISNVSKAPLSRAKTIVRTEGHRIQQKSTKDAQQQAKSKGADVVKQWDSTLDGKTRPSHKKVDGEIRELDEKFSNGLDYPGDPSGKAGEVVNCRCVSLSRARWALDEDELKTLKERAKFFELDKAKTFEDFKEKYLKVATEPLEKSSKSSTIKGAISGAYNNKNDPDGEKRDAHAERYYSSIRNGKKKDVVDAIATNANIESEYVSKMYDHLFVNEYDLDKGHTRFDSDYYIAESIQRLRDGKDIQSHDLTLVYHEAMEYDLMNNEGLNYEKAHEIANRSFNYQKDLDKWLDENEK